MATELKLSVKMLVAQNVSPVGISLWRSQVGNEGGGMARTLAKGRELAPSIPNALQLVFL